jgi:hypothetical protein
LERFGEGTTRSWFWKQVLIASAESAWSEVRRRWIFFCYAAVGILAIDLTPIYEPTRFFFWLPWNDLPWPLSQLVLELGDQSVAIVLALGALVVGHRIERSLQSAHLSRIWVINLALMALGDFIMDVLPSLLRPIPGEPYREVAMLPGVLQTILLGFSFLIAAWVGCPMIERANKQGAWSQTGATT